MSSAPDGFSENGAPEPDRGYEGYASETPAPPARPGLLHRIRAFFSRVETRIDDPREVKIPVTLILAVIMLLLVPSVAGYVVRAYISASHRALDTSLQLQDGTIDPVTALVWSAGTDDRVFVGTRSGRLLAFDTGGTSTDFTIPPAQGQTAGPVAAIQMAATGGNPVAVMMSAEPATGGLPPGPLGQSLPYGPETCKNGYVWREGAQADLVCVTPESRTRALKDNAVVATRSSALAAPVCGAGLVLRQAFAGDLVCVDAKTAADTVEENRLDQSRKVLPDAARQASPKLELQGIQAERGIVAISGNMVIAGRAPDQPIQDVQLQQQQQQQVIVAAAPTRLAGQTITQAAPQSADTIPVASVSASAAGGLTQWTLAETPPVEVGQIFGIDDARHVAALPGTSAVAAGDGRGGVFLFDASQQVSGTNPDQYLQELGNHDAVVTEIAVAAAPLATNPSFATAAADGTVKVWWDRQVQPNVTQARFADVAPAALTWETVADISGGEWNSLDAFSEDGTRMVVGTSDNRLSLIEIPKQTPSGQAGTVSPSRALPVALSAPAAFSSDGAYLAAYDSAAASVDILDVSGNNATRRVSGFQAPLRDILFDPTGKTLALLSDNGSVSTYNVDKTGANPAPDLAGGQARSIALSPDGSLIAMGFDDGSVRLNRVSDGKQIAGLTALAARGQSGTRIIGSWPMEVGFSPSGKQLVLFDTANGRLSRYSIRNRRLQGPVQVDTAGPAFGALTADTSRIVARANNKPFLIVADARLGTSLQEMENDAFGTVRPNRDASRLAIKLATSGDVTVLQQTPDPSRTGPMPPIAEDGLRLSADGSTLLLREPSGLLHVADLRQITNGRATLVPILPSVRAMRAELAADGQSVIVGEADGTIDLVDLAGDNSVPILGHGDIIQAMAVSTDGAYLASASLDGRLRITNLKLARLVSEMPLASLSSNRASPRMTPRFLDAAPAGATQPLAVLPATTGADTAPPAANAVAPNAAAAIQGPATGADTPPPAANAAAPTTPATTPAANSPAQTNPLLASIQARLSRRIEGGTRRVRIIVTSSISPSDR